jgi:hypothetical protein
MSDEIVTALLTAQSRMEEVRQGCDDLSQKCFNYVNPRRYDMTGTATKGAERKTKMYDGVAQDAFLTWRDGIIGWFVGPAVTSTGPGWQKAALGNVPGLRFADAQRLRDDDAVKAYLQDYTDQMRREFDASNFYDVEAEWLQDLGSGGTGTIIAQESEDLSRAVLRAPHPARVWIDQNQDFEVDVYHEQLTMTARQCLQRYKKPGDTLHPTIKKWAESAESAGWEVTLLQCVRPSNDGIFDARLGWSKYSIVTLLQSFQAGVGATTDTDLKAPGDRLIRIEPLKRFTPVVTFMRRNSDELYGWSQAMDVMTVIESAQQHAYNLLNLGNLAANPVTWSPSELKGLVKYLPGSKNFYGSEKRIGFTQPMGGEYPIAIDREDKLHALIRSRYGYDLFRMMSAYQQKRERNQAYEVSEARVDQARLMVSQTGNLWKSGFVPTYNSIAQIAADAGRLPEPPAVLQDLAGRDVIIIDPIGPLSQLQELAATVSPLQQGMRFLADVAEIIGRHVSPQMAAQIYHRVNLPDLAEFALDKTGFPRRLMRSDEEVAALTQRDEQQMAAQQQAANAQKLAAAAAQMGKPVDESSLLAGVA